jgi:hypothetical protein
VIAADDAMLAASDPAVPGLATVLDEERLAALLRANLSSVPIGVARRTYARYKPERSCVVAYRLEVAGSELDVYAIAHRREHFARHASNLSGDRGDGTALGRGVALEEASVIVRPFTADRRIATLAELADEARRRKLVYELLPGDPSLWSGKVETLRYWPERRFTCCLTIAGEPRVVVKFYNEALYPPAARAVAAFDCRAPRIPRLIASSDRHRALVFQWLSGERLDRGLRGRSSLPCLNESVWRSLSFIPSLPLG